jgi:uncharacterized membrane protein YdjX (TVP38/TMEM64 family)
MLFGPLLSFAGNRIASALGLTTGSVLTLIVAGYMSSQIANEITTNSYEALRVPVLGWYLNGQDIRIPIFWRHI